MPLIRFDDVSKRFVLHHERARSFQDVFVGMFRRDRSREAFWALRDISFEIGQGESVAIVGPNGSGKSTTLKLISRILQPTRGTVTVEKRVSALLELGAGFHPELTGRENIFLNGSLLGFSRAEMLRQFDDIVEFAELEQFIDTPIKNYSSGMVVRLGFAVAVFTDPEILITDEVLAVGDQAFSEKCLERIWQFRREGRTIIFVSHSLDSVRQLCNRAIWLQKGEVMADGPATEVVDSYLMAVHQRKKTGDTAPRIENSRRWGSQEAVITSVAFYDGNGLRRDTFETGESLVVRVSFNALEKIERPQFGIGIHRADGVHVAAPNNVANGVTVPAIHGPGSFEYRIPRLPLLEGTYEITTAIYDEHAIHPYDHHDRMYAIHVHNGIAADRWGVVDIPCEWIIQNDDNSASGPTRLVA